MDQTALFRLNDKAYQYYLQVILVEQDNLAEFMLPSSGAF
jgi:hypothetical protein